MAITLTAVHKRRLLNQVEQNLTGLQRDMHNNAIAHKAMAQAQSPDLSILATFVRDAALEYLRRLQWVIDLRANPTRRQRLVDMLTSAGWTEQEIVDFVQELRAASIALRDAPRTTYVEIISACDQVLATVDAPESLWPE